MKKNTMRNLVLPEMSLANSKTQYKPYFSTLPKKNKENAEYISPLGYL